MNLLENMKVYLRVKIQSHYVLDSKLITFSNEQRKGKKKKPENLFKVVNLLERKVV